MTQLSSHAGSQCLSEKLHGECPYKRILYHHRTQGKGVEGVHINGIADAWSQIGAEVDILGPIGVRSDGKQEPSHESSSSRKSRRFLAWFAATVPEFAFEVCEILYNLVAFPRLVIRLLRRKPDLIYERYALFLFSGVMAAKLCGVPIVLEVNDSAVTARSRPLGLKMIARRCERWILRHATIVATVSQPFKRSLLTHGFPSDHIMVTPNAVSRNDWAEMPAENKGSQLTIVYVAAFVHWHRPDLMVRSFAALTEMRLGIRLMLVGDGPASSEAQKLAETLGVTDLVTFTGRVSPKEVREILCQSDIAVMGHSNSHGSPMKILEYMAAGKAVVAPRVEPVEEIVTDGITGLLFTPLCQLEMQECLLRLIDDENLRTRLGQAARRHVMQEHTWCNNLSRILASLKDIVEKGKNA